MRGLSLLALAVLAAAGCDVHVNDKGVSVDLAQGKATDEWSRTYSIDQGGRLEIVNTNGAIELGAATGPAVDVHATREVRAESDEAARELLHGIEVSEQVTPGSVRIEARTPARAGGGGFRRRPRVSISYRVTIPPGLSAVVRSENGPIRLDNVDGLLDVATTSGNITGRSVSGSVTASTVNGAVQMGLETIRGDVEITAVNGGIRVELSRSADAQLDASTVNGGVRVDDELPLESTVRDRLRVAGRINKGGPRLALHTTNGGVRVGVRER